MWLTVPIIFSFKLRAKALIKCECFRGRLKLSIYSIVEISISHRWILMDSIRAVPTSNTSLGNVNNILGPLNKSLFMQLKQA